LHSEAIPQRIVSFLPSATEMVCALGLYDRLAGVTHECDFPPEVKDKPVVVRPALPVEHMTQAEIDAAVSQRLQSGLGLYEVDEARLLEIAPDLILTQDLCQVCAPSGNEISQLLTVLPRKPDILWLTPKSLDGIFENIQELGEATGRSRQAQGVIRRARQRLKDIAAKAARVRHRPRVFCMEWMDPVYCCGHWIPEMIRIAGGVDGLGREGADSVRVSWTDILCWAPEVLVVMPCGFDLPKTVAESKRLDLYECWRDIPAVREHHVYAVDANAYFARPGPRVVEGTELLAHLLHPDLFEWTKPGAFQQLRAPDVQRSATSRALC
jgi:iron complex transport system substrate-binding protein